MTHTGHRQQLSHAGHGTVPGCPPPGASSPPCCWDWLPRCGPGASGVWKATEVVDGPAGILRYSFPGPALGRGPRLGGHSPAPRRRESGLALTSALRIWDCFSPPPLPRILDWRTFRLAPRPASGAQPSSGRSLASTRAREGARRPSRSRVTLMPQGRWRHLHGAQQLASHVDSVALGGLSRPAPWRPARSACWSW